jgi:Ion channel
MTGGMAVVLRRRKYAVLLALLCVALAIETFSARGAERFLAAAAASVLAFAIWFVVFERRHERAVMAATLLATLAISWVLYLAPTDLNHALFVATDTLMSVFLWSAVCAILRDLFRTRATGAEDVLGAICGYLIAGAAWGRINALAYLLVPSAYSINPAVAALLSDFGRVALFTYYAFAQVLTIGYSDVTPVRAPATTLSLFAALFGVFYTAIVVSVFVGLAQSARAGGGKE